jgi:hypothetical protein
LIACVEADQPPLVFTRRACTKRPAPVTLVEARDRDVLAGTRGMHEAAVAEVDADVVHAALATEEDQVAGDQFGAVGDELAVLGHVAGHAWQFDAQRIAEDIADQAAAVETIVRIGAAPAIRRAEQGECLLQHALDLAVVADGRTDGFVGEFQRCRRVQQAIGACHQVERAAGQRGSGVGRDRGPSASRGTAQHRPPVPRRPTTPARRAPAQATNATKPGQAGKGWEPAGRPYFGVTQSVANHKPVAIMPTRPGDVVQKKLVIR